MHDKTLRLGIDLGGTKIEAVVLQGADNILWRQRVATPQSDYDATLAVIDRLISQSSDKFNLPADMPLGIGTPGTLRLDGRGMKNCNSTCLNSRPLLTDLQSQLQRPVRIANDANCFALAEARVGAGRGAESVFGVILGTGVGGGLVIGGQLLVGRNRIAGEWGHNPLPRMPDRDVEMRTCYCGAQNCIEAFLSGPGLSESYALQQAALGNESSGRPSRLLDAEDIVRRAAEGEACAVRVWSDYQYTLAVSLAQVINILDPDVIVLGGGLSNAVDLYAKIPTLWRQAIFSDEVDTRLCQAQCGDSAGVLGAAWLWP